MVCKVEDWTREPDVPVDLRGAVVLRCRFLRRTDEGGEVCDRVKGEETLERGWGEI